MPRNGSGTYTLPAGNPVVTGTTISSTTQNTTMSDIAAALTNSVSKDGQTTMTGNLPMGGFKATSLGVGTAATDSANLSQVQSGASSQLTSISGTDAILAFGSPSVASYATGAKYTFVAANTNTGAATINIDSIGSKSITKYGATALAAGDILAGAEHFIVYDGTQFQLLNPATIVINDGSITSAKLAAGAATLAKIDTTGAAGQVLTSQGGGLAVIWRDKFWKSGVIATTSGTSIDVTTIPSWITRLTIPFSSVSSSGSNNWLLQIGSGSILTSGYNGNVTRTAGTLLQTNTSTSGALINVIAASASVSGAIEIILLGNNVYTIKGSLGDTAGSNYFLAFSVTLSGAMDRIRLSFGGDTADAGSISVLGE